jgi:hypothetical protein
VGVAKVCLVVVAVVRMGNMGWMRFWRGLFRGVRWELGLFQVCPLDFLLGACWADGGYRCRGDRRHCSRLGLLMTDDPVEREHDSLKADPQSRMRDLGAGVDSSRAPDTNVLVSSVSPRILRRRKSGYWNAYARGL